MALTIDFDDLTLGEAQDIESETGFNILSPGAIQRDNIPLSVLRGLLWVFTRRQNPGFTYEDAGAVRMQDVTFALTSAAEEKGATRPIDLVPRRSRRTPKDGA